MSPNLCVRRSLAALSVLCLSLALPAHASLGVLAGEPYGSFGTMAPVGHTALYFDHLCTDTPSTVRPCSPGEAGVAVGRYHRIGNLDWLAIPIVSFLYGVDDPAKTPTFITPQTESELRENYRKTHLAAIIPDRVDAAGRDRPAHKGEWAETIGSAFDRRIFLYEFDTTPEQDAALLAWLQSRPNRRRYSLRRANCADFTADAINLLYPNSVRRNRFADFDMMTPKQVTRALEAFGEAHPELHPRVYEIPQLPGTLRRSRPLRGAAETFVKTKRYLALFLITQPELVLADWAIYEDKGKWKPTQTAISVSPMSWSKPVENTERITSAESTVLSSRSSGLTSNQ
jgi:hypothetical protein